MSHRAETCISPCSARASRIFSRERSASCLNRAASSLTVSSVTLRAEAVEFALAGRLPLRGLVMVGDVVLKEEPSGGLGCAGGRDRMPANIPAPQCGSMEIQPGRGFLPGPRYSVTAGGSGEQPVVLEGLPQAGLGRAVHGAQGQA